MKLHMYSGGERTGTEMVFMGTRSGLTRYWSFQNQLPKQYDFSYAFTFSRR